MRCQNKLKGIYIVASVLLLGAFFAFAVTGHLVANGRGVHHEDPINIDELMKEVLVLNQNKQYQKAIDLLLKAVERQKGDPILRTLLVENFDLFLADEIKRGQENIRHHPNDPHAYLSVSGALELLGDNFHAMEILLQGVSHKPTAELWMRIAGLEEKAGRKLEALDVFREVIRLDKKNSLARNNAAFIIAMQAKSKDDHRLKEALKLAKQALKLDPKNPQYIDTLAEVYFRKGENAAAQNLMKEAIKLAPESEPFKSRLENFENASKKP